MIIRMKKHNVVHLNKKSMYKSIIKKIAWVFLNLSISTFNLRKLFLQFVISIFKDNISSGCRKSFVCTCLTVGDSSELHGKAYLPSDRRTCFNPLNSNQSWLVCIGSFGIFGFTDQNPQQRCTMKPPGTASFVHEVVLEHFPSQRPFVLRLLGNDEITSS